MSILIAKSNFPSRFIITGYNEKVMELIRPLDKKYWCSKWSLPLIYAEKLIEQLKLNNIDHVDELTEFLNEPKVLVTMNGDNLQLKFKSFCEEFNTLKSIRESSYNKENRILSIPIDSKQKVFTLLKAFNIKFKCEN